MIDQFPRGKALVRGEFVGRGRQVLNDGRLFFAQIGFAQLRPRFLRLDLVDAGIDGDPRNPMFQRHFARELGELLHDLDKNHLAKVLLGASSRSMGADQFCHQRVKRGDQFASSVVILPQSRRHQLP